MTKTTKNSKPFDISYIMIPVIIIILTAIGCLLVSLADITSITCIRDNNNTGNCVFSKKTPIEYSKLKFPVKDIETIDWEYSRKFTNYYLKTLDNRRVDIDMEISKENRREVFAKLNRFLSDKNIKTFDYTDDKRGFLYPIAGAPIFVAILLLLGYIARILILFYDFLFHWK